MLVAEFLVVAVEDAGGVLRTSVRYDIARECIEAGYRFYRFDAASVQGTNIYDARERVVRVAEDCVEKAHELSPSRGCVRPHNAKPPRRFPGRAPPSQPVTKVRRLESAGRGPNP